MSNQRKEDRCLRTAAFGGEAGSIAYGNIELMYGKSENRAYSSYNYGNNFFTHFLIDYLGWKGRGN